MTRPLRNGASSGFGVAIDCPSDRAALCRWPSSGSAARRGAAERPGNCADVPAGTRGSEPWFGVSRPVGRVLCTRSRGPAAIHLGLPLPAASCGLPAGIGRAALERSRRSAGEPADPLDLAPGGVYRAAAVACGAGGLLHHRFTLTPAPSRCRGGLLSVALSRGSPRVGVTDHLALWSPDLPRRTRVGPPRPPGRLTLGTRIRRGPRQLTRNRPRCRRKLNTGSGLNNGMVTARGRRACRAD